MPFINPLTIAAGGALLKGLGSFFGKKSKQKDQKKAAAELNRSGQLQHTNSETKRTANLRTLQAAAAARGVPLNMDPAILETMPYAGLDPTKFVGGTNLLGGALEGIGGLGINYATYKANQDALGESGGEFSGAGAGGAFGGPAERPMPWDNDDIVSILLRQLEEQKNKPGPWRSPTSPGQPTYDGRL